MSWKTSRINYQTLYELHLLRIQCGEIFNLAVMVMTLNAVSAGEIVVANNPYVPVALLDSLAKSADWQVRTYVARNQNTSLNTLQRLAGDSVENVCQLAEKRLQMGKKQT